MNNPPAHVLAALRDHGQPISADDRVLPSWLMDWLLHSLDPIEPVCGEVVGYQHVIGEPTVTPIYAKPVKGGIGGGSTI